MTNRTTIAPFRVVSLCTLLSLLLLLCLSEKTTTTTAFQPSSVVESLPTKQQQQQQKWALTTTNVSGGAATSGGDATIPNEIFNLVKGIVGAGVLALPAGIAQMGNTPTTVLPAVCLIALIGGLSAYGFGLIGRVCSLTNCDSFASAWENTVSKKTSWIPNLSVLAVTFFAILAYSMILGDTFQSLASSAGYTLSKTTCLSTLTVTVLFPLCLLKNLSSLAPFSLLGTAGMLYTAIAMTIRYLGSAYKTGGKLLGDVAAAPSFGSSYGRLFSPSTAILLGMLSTSYMAHFNAPKFYTELKNNTVPRYMAVTLASFAISVLLFGWIAAMGFLTFGSSSSGMILNNYSNMDGIMGVSRIAVALSLVFSYPLAFVGARNGVLDLMNIKDRSAKMLNGLTMGILSAVTLAALKIPDVSFVLAFAGATFGNALIYIFPGLMFRGAIKKLSNPSKRQKTEVKFAMVSLVVGTILGAMGATQAVKSIL